MSDTIWAGRILNVDLTSGRLTVQRTSDYASYALGARGIGQWTLFREVVPGTDALDPENILAFGAGALTGTPAPASGRLAIDTLNALTGGVCMSNAGGHFAPELKYAGFDSVIVRGQAPVPVVLWVHDGKAALVPAEDLWGRDVWQTEDTLRARMGREVRVAAIGPAGENLVRGACVMVDRARAAGRGGLGAVMGSKRLKAIVVRGSGDLLPVDGERFMRTAQRCRSNMLASPYLNVMREGGSMRLGGAGGPDGMGPQSFKNYRDEFWPPAKSRKIYEPAVKEQFEVRRLGCYNCPVACGHYYRVAEGPYAGSEGEGFQVNTARAFGSNLDIDYAPALIEAHNYCSRMGLDVDMAGNILAWAFEAYERGHLSRAEANGLALEWGDHETAIELLHAVVERRGVGDLLAEGTRRAAAALGRGSDAYAMHVKGGEINEGNMRQVVAWALAVTMSTEAGSHLDGAPAARTYRGLEDLSQRYFGVVWPGDLRDYSGQAPVVIWHEYYKALIDMMGACYFTSMWVDAFTYQPEDVAELMSAGTGREYTADELMKMGQRLHNVQKAFNTLHTGATRADDRPPHRLFQEPVQTGPAAGAVLDSERWESLLDEYYTIKGWDPASGWQTRQSLAALGLDEVADKLHAYGRLKGD